MTLFLLIEEWFDRRTVARIQNILRQDERFGGLDPESAVIYRVPMPAKAEVVLETRGLVERFRRTFLEVVGLGDRLYVVDGAPLAYFFRPVAALVYRGFGSTPHVVLPARAHIFINGRPFPFFDPERLREWAVFNQESIPRWPVVPDKEGILATVAPLAPGFPPTDVPVPTAPPAPSGAAPNTQGKKYFFGLCFQNPLARTAKDRDHIHEALLTIRFAFKACGYEDRMLTAGEDLSTFDKMMTQFQTDVQASAFCSDPNDQLVICLGAHGEPGKLLYQPNKQTADDVTPAAFMQRIAAVPKISGGAAKVYFIIKSCGSGQFFDSTPIPASLDGAHLITSSPDDSISYGGELEDYVDGALSDPGVTSWDDFVKGIKWRWQQHTGHLGKAPRNGDIGTGCRITVTLKSIRYTGANVGTNWRFEAVVNSNDAGKANVAPHTVAHNASTPENAVVYDFFVGKCGNKMELDINTSAILVQPAPAGEWRAYGILRHQVVCPGSGAAPAITTATVDVPCDPGGKQCTMTATYEFRAQCI